MTKLENFRRLMNRSGAQWMPLDMPVTPPVLDEIRQRTGKESAVEAFDLDFQSVRVRWDAADDVTWRAAYRLAGYELPPDAELWGDGVAHVKPDPGTVGKAYHFRTMIHPLENVQTVRQLESMPWPTLEMDANIARLRMEIEAIHSAGRVAVLGAECSVFECAWYMRGMDNLFMDLAEGNPVGPWLLDHVAGKTTAKVTAAARAGIDVIGLGDDVGTQRGMLLAVDQWRQHLKPRLKGIIDAIRANEARPVAIRYHSDGDIRAILDDLVELGVDILNPVQPECMPPGEVIPRYQDRLAFWGMIGTQTTMPFGTPDDVRTAVAECRRLFQAGARTIVAPTHVLEPDVPWENIVALVEAIRTV